VLGVDDEVASYADLAVVAVLCDYREPFVRGPDFADLPSAPAEMDEPSPPQQGPAEPVKAGRRLRSRRRPAVRQFDATDRAVATLASVARFYGRSVPTTYLRDTAGTDTEGTSLRGICAAGRAVGLEMGPVKVSRTMSLPAIIHWEQRHWVVLYEVTEGAAVIGGPASGLRKVSGDELTRAWSGYSTLARAAIPLIVGRLVDDLSAHKGQGTALAPLGTLISGVVVGAVVGSFRFRPAAPDVDLGRRPGHVGPAGPPPRRARPRARTGP
jgi:hypothetical protein